MTLRKTGSLPFILAALLTVSCGGAAPVSHGTEPSGTLAATSQPAGTPRQRAAADAKAILGEFVPPPGAIRLAKQPALADYPGMDMNFDVQADAVGYWRASEAP